MNNLPELQKAVEIIKENYLACLPLSPDRLHAEMKKKIPRSLELPNQRTFRDWMNGKSHPYSQQKFIPCIFRFAAVKTAEEQFPLFERFKIVFRSNAEKPLFDMVRLYLKGFVFFRVGGKPSEEKLISYVRELTGHRVASGSIEGVMNDGHIPEGDDFAAIAAYLAHPRIEYLDAELLLQRAKNKKLDNNFPHELAAYLSDYSGIKHLPFKSKLEATYVNFDPLNNTHTRLVFEMPEREFLMNVRQEIDTDGKPGDISDGWAVMTPAGSIIVLLKHALFKRNRFYFGIIATSDTEDLPVELTLIRQCEFGGDVYNKEKRASKKKPSYAAIIKHPDI